MPHEKSEGKWCLKHRPSNEKKLQVNEEKEKDLQTKRLWSVVLCPRRGVEKVEKTWQKSGQQDSRLTVYVMYGAR